MGKKKPTKFTPSNCVKLAEYIANHMNKEQLTIMVGTYLYCDMVGAEEKFRLNLKLENVEHWK